MSSDKEELIVDTDKSYTHDQEKDDDQVDFEETNSKKPNSETDTFFFMDES